MMSTKRSGFALCSLCLVAVAAACSADDPSAEDIGSDDDALGTLSAQYTYLPARPEAGRPVYLPGQSVRSASGNASFSFSTFGSAVNTM